MYRLQRSEDDNGFSESLSIAKVNFQQVITREKPARPSFRASNLRSNGFEAGLSAIGRPVPLGLPPLPLLPPHDYCRRHNRHWPTQTMPRWPTQSYQPVILVANTAAEPFVPDTEVNTCSFAVTKCQLILSFQLASSTMTVSQSRSGFSQQ